MESEEKTRFIVEKWKDVTYRGCFSGVTALTKMLNTDFETHFSKPEVIDALLTIPSYVNRVNNKKTTKKRKYDITDAFDTWTLDLTFMSKVKLFIGFLLCVDIGSRRIYTRLITNKRAATVKKCLMDIWNKDCEGYKPTNIITDAGKEFVGLKSFFKSEKIYLKIIRTDTKASISERYIGIVKSRLMKALDTLETTNWPKLLDDITLAINSTENKAIGNIQPITITTPWTRRIKHSSW